MCVWLCVCASMCVRACVRVWARACGHICVCPCHCAEMHVLQVIGGWHKTWLRRWWSRPHLHAAVHNKLRCALSKLVSVCWQGPLHLSPSKRLGWASRNAVIDSNLCAHACTHADVACTRLGGELPSVYHGQPHHQELHPTHQHIHIPGTLGAHEKKWRRPFAASCNLGVTVPCAFVWCKPEAVLS